jgi:hypothetical protein
VIDPTGEWDPRAGLDVLSRSDLVIGWLKFDYCSMERDVMSILQSPCSRTRYLSNQIIIKQFFHRSLYISLLRYGRSKGALSVAFAIGLLESIEA